MASDTFDPSDRSNARLSVKILLPVALFLFLLGVDEIIYFSPMAAAVSFVSTVLTVYGIWQFKKMTAVSLPF